MRPFDYEALDGRGRTKKGVITAESVKGARRDLRARGLVPVHVLEGSEDNTPKGEITLSAKHLGHKDRTLITRQLATMIDAAAPIEEALNTVALQAEKPVVKKILLGVRASVMEGHKLSDALAEKPKSFDPLYRAMVSAGESAGNLPGVLNRLSDLMERTQEIRTKVQTALIYPAALAVTATAVVIALMTFVVPKVVDQFSTMGQTLPTLTQVMIAVSHFLRDYGLVLAAVCLVVLVAFIRALKLSAFRKYVDGTLLRIPMIGKLIRALNTARLTRTLSTLIASGAPALDALKASARTVSNTVMREAVDQMVIDIEEGSSLSNAFKRAGLFPPMVGYMAAAGETSGKLADMLGKSADYLEREFESFIDAALSLLEPGIIIIMGAVVATIVLSILLPILQLNTLAAF